MKQDETINNGSLIMQFMDKANATIKSLHPEEDITFIKIRSAIYEIMIAPEKEFSLIVLQNPANDENNWRKFQNTYAVTDPMK